MKIAKRDLIVFGSIILILIALIFVSTAQKKPKAVPVDDKHRVFYQAMQRGSNRIETEKGCTLCHNPQAIPLPKKHPPKEQCLVCHKLTGT